MEKYRVLVKLIICTGKHELVDSAEAYKDGDGKKFQARDSKEPAGIESLLKKTYL